MKTALNRPAPLRGSEEFFAQTERQQSMVRLILAAAIACYIGLLGATGVIGQPLLRFFVAETVLIFAVALFIHWSVRTGPGIRHWRRALAMATDYGATTVLIGVGGAVMTPIFVVLLWITLGYGIRYGRTYLLIGAGLSLTSVVCLALVVSRMWWKLPSSGLRACDVGSSQAARSSAIGSSG